MHGDVSAGRAEDKVQKRYRWLGGLCLVAAFTLTSIRCEAETFTGRMIIAAAAGLFVALGILCFRKVGTI